MLQARVLTQPPDVELELSQPSMSQSHSGKGGEPQAMLGPQALPQVLWSLARLQWRIPSRLAAELVSASAALAPRLTPQGVTMVLYFAARFEQQPRQGEMDALLGCARAGILAASAAEPSNAASWRPPQQHQAVARGSLGSGGVAGNAQCEAPLASMQAAGAGAGSGSHTAGTLEGEPVQPLTVALMVWALAKMRYYPGEGWMRELLVHTVQVNRPCGS